MGKFIVIYSKVVYGNEEEVIKESLKDAGLNESELDNQCKVAEIWEMQRFSSKKVYDNFEMPNLRNDNE
jgi:hypothetical protein